MVFFERAGEYPILDKFGLVSSHTGWRTSATSHFSSTSHNLFLCKYLSFAILDLEGPCFSGPVPGVARNDPGEEGVNQNNKDIWLKNPSMEEPELCRLRPFSWNSFRELSWRVFIILRITWKRFSVLNHLEKMDLVNSRTTTVRQKSTQKKRATSEGSPSGAPAVRHHYNLKTKTVQCPSPTKYWRGFALLIGHISKPR